MIHLIAVVLKVDSTVPPVGGKAKKGLEWIGALQLFFNFSSDSEIHFRSHEYFVSDRGIRFRFIFLTEIKTYHITITAMFSYTSKYFRDGLRASYNISVLIVRKGKPHDIREELIIQFIPALK